MARKSFSNEGVAPSVDSGCGRRSFIGIAAAGAAMPLFNIGCAGFGRSRARQIASGQKIRVALIGCGLRMRQVLSTKCENEQIVALVDPWKSAMDRMRKRLCNIYPGRGYESIPGFATYQDLYDTMGDGIDAVIIATNQQQHALPALLAMQRGIHVYVEKPIAYSVEEADMLLEAALKYGVVSQSGHHGHSSPIMATAVEYIRSGAIGNVHDVWCFDDRINSQAVVPPDAPVPEGLDWDLWVGPAAMRPYKTCYGPHQWYDWKGFGNGNIGNMGNHIMDASFYALRLDEVSPVSAELFDQRDGAPGSWPLRQTVDFRFPSRKGLDPVTIHWWDGIKDGIPVAPTHQNRIGIAIKREYQNLPPIVEELERKHGVRLGQVGSLFMGDKGIMWVNEFGSAIQFVPTSLRKGIAKPKPWIPRVRKSHVHEFFAAIREGRQANADFRYGVPLVKTVLLGNVLAETGIGKLEWNGARVTNNAAANAFLKTTYRKGWELPTV